MFRFANIVFLYMLSLFLIFKTLYFINRFYFIFSIVAKYTQYQIHHSHYFQVYSSVAPSTPTLLYNHHHDPSPEPLHLSQLKSSAH